MADFIIHNARQISYKVELLARLRELQEHRRAMCLQLLIVIF